MCSEAYVNCAVLVARIRISDNALCRYPGEILCCDYAQEMFVLAISLVDVTITAGFDRLGGELANSSRCLQLNI